MDNIDQVTVLKMAKELEESQKKIYRCLTCSYKTPHKSNFTKHEKIHLAQEERQLFVCPHCDKIYTRKHGLQYHLVNNHIDSRAKTLKESQKKVYRCSICSYKTPHNFTLNKHKRIHLPPEERQMKELQKKVYRCCTCSYQTTNKSNFNNHKKIHLAPEKRQMFACLHCEKTYTRKQRLQSHLENNHIDSRSRNADCTSVTHEVILDSLKIEIDDHTALKDEYRNAECLSVDEVKPFLKIEPDDVAPILHKDLQEDFKNAENLSIAKKVKLEDFIKMEPDDDSVS